MIETLPKPVTDAYEISSDAVAHELGEGLVNTTYLIDDHGERTVLQKMADMFPIGAMHDMQAVTERLALRGWIVPTLLPTNQGAAYAQDDEHGLWRRTAHIDSDGHTPNDISPELTKDTAALLGRWHSDMRDFEHTFAFQIPYFHNVDHQAVKTESYLYGDGFEPADYTLASELVSMSRKYPAVHDDVQQVIHADPKLGNILFQDGKPFTLIDFDTVMRGSPWTDCGDFLRSVSGKLVSQSIDPGAHIETFATAYAAETNQDESMTHKAVSRATGRIAINLGMRYMCDILDAGYFKWDNSRYETRRDNHLARAEQQLIIAQRALAA